MTVTRKKGVWSEEKAIAYSGGSGSNELRDGISIMKANDGEPYIANTVKLDDMFRGKRVTFIKMDIEGAEIPALYGAQEIIGREHPKLVICVYHKTSDLWEIPLLTKKFRAEYRLRLRHHARVNCWGTVLYGY